MSSYSYLPVGFDCNAVRDFIADNPGLEISFDHDMFSDKTIVRVRCLHSGTLVNHSIDNFVIARTGSVLGLPTLMDLKEAIYNHLATTEPKHPKSLFNYPVYKFDYGVPLKDEDKKKKLTDLSENIDDLGTF